MKASAHTYCKMRAVARGRQVLKSRVGQAMTEFALVLPVLVLIFIGVLDLGRAFHTHVAVSNAARVGLLFAQQVASPRMLDCAPGSTCYFITVGDIIAKVKQEAQGGIDASQMQVTVCLKTCPAPDTEAVAGNEDITVTVTVPFTPITPLVHLSSIGGTVSGSTFPFEPTGATVTPAPSPTSTPIPSPTAIPPTPSPVPIPNIISTPTATGTGTNSVTIQWQTDQTSANEIYVQLKNSSAWKPFATLDGNIGNISFTTDPNSPYYLAPGTYHFYVTSTTSGGTMYYPSCASSGSCTNGNGNNAYLSFQLN